MSDPAALKLAREICALIDAPCVMVFDAERPPCTAENCLPMRIAAPVQTQLVDLQARAKRAEDKAEDARTMLVATGEALAVAHQEAASLRQALAAATGALERIEGDECAPHKLSMPCEPVDALDAYGEPLLAARATLAAGPAQPLGGEEK